MRVPFLLEPAAKDYLWGGSRLNDDFGKGIDLKPLAETWECSTHPDGESLVGGEPLSRVLSRHPEWLGTHPLHTMGGRPELPILVKLIDAQQDLSVQVHPDDAYALKHEGSLGKTEFWYVLAARDGAKLVYGFDQLIQRATGIPCHVADDAILCVALGCGKSLKWIDEMQEGTINLARRKLMAE